MVGLVVDIELREILLLALLVVLTAAILSVRGPDDDGGAT